jgi:RNA polymerase sigma-70 factor (ECF subfamily)
MDKYAHKDVFCAKVYSAVCPAYGAGNEPGFLRNELRILPNPYLYDDTASPMPSPNSHTDTELLAAIQKDDEGAFTILYLRYWDKLFYLAGKKLGDLPEAENIVQDIFLDLWHRRHELDIRHNIDGYLVVAVKYRIINAQAKRHRREAMSRQAGRQLAEADHSTEQQLAYEELCSLLQEKMLRLPEKCRMVFALREQGLSQKEIASQMNISEKTVEMHVSRALKSLRTVVRSLFSFF